jgi:MOB kinase activator 1
MACSVSLSAYSHSIIFFDKSLKIQRLITAVDFFNELSLIWGIVHDFGVEKLNISEGFPPGFEYRWAGDKKTAVSCSGPEYVEHVLNWLDKEINNDRLFPTSSG